MIVSENYFIFAHATVINGTAQNVLYSFNFLKNICAFFI